MLRADVRANMEEHGEWSRGRLAVATALKILFTTRLQAVILLRVAQAAHRVAPPVAALVKYVNNVVCGCDIAAEARIGPGLRLYHPTGVVIGPDCVVGARCVVMQGVTLGKGVGGSPHVGDRVFLGPGAKVFGALTIGSDCHVGANAVVMNPVPEGHFAAGIPARVIKRIAEVEAA
jgi:serine O-acetyltransferase